LNHTFSRIAGATLLLIAGQSFAAGSLSVTREVTVDVSPATAWKLVGNFNGLDVWHPAIKNSELTGSGVKSGSKRVLTLGDGAKIDEKLESYSATKLSYTYSITKSPLPVKNYVSTISVSPAADGKALVKWSSTFDANGAPDAKATEVIGGVYDGGLARVAATLKK
jgi:mxaD protein